LLLLEYVFLVFIVWVRSVSKMLPSVKFEEDKVLVFVILREKKTLPLTVFTQRNFVANFLQAKCDFRRKSTVLRF